MKLNSISFALMAAIALSSCSSEEIVDTNSDVQGKAISFNPMVGHATRAVETTIYNLGDFSVYAKGVHPHGTLYGSLIIGDDTNGAETAHYNNESITTDKKGTWELDRKVYWPSGMENMLFWAFTTQQRTKSADDNTTLYSGNISFDHSTGPKITGFEPKRADLATSGNEWIDGHNQKDLLIAFTHQKSSEPTTISLNFKHALSQIDIQAQQRDKEDTDHRIVKIKGAWIVNAKTKGTLSAGFKSSNNNNIFACTENATWALDNVLGLYGSYYQNLKELTSTGDPISILGNNNDGNLMIIPQSVSKWDESTNDNNSGAYILLLCRVELKHLGSSHDGNDGDLSDIHIEGDYHYHQLFPANDTYDAEQYGFSCVPLSAAWEMGKKYTYTLDICGKETGAGIYPPIISDDMLKTLVPTSEQGKIIRNTDEAKVGKKVLNEPIKFSVSVTGWANQTGEWINGK